MTIPVGMVTEFKNAIASGRKLRDLVLELSAADTSLLVEQSSALKKLAHLVLRGAAKIQSVVDAAAAVTVQLAAPPHRGEYATASLAPCAANLTPVRVSSRIDAPVARANAALSAQPLAAASATIAIISCFFIVSFLSNSIMPH